MKCSELMNKWTERPVRFIDPRWCPEVHIMRSSIEKKKRNWKSATTHIDFRYNLLSFRYSSEQLLASWVKQTAWWWVISSERKSLLHCLYGVTHNTIKPRHMLPKCVASWKPALWPWQRQVSCNLLRCNCNYPCGEEGLTTVHWRVWKIELQLAEVMVVFVVILK